MNTETTTKNTIRAMLKSGQFITAPGVFDLVSAKLADRSGCRLAGRAPAVSPRRLHLPKCRQARPRA